jgi:uncharacterized protein
MRQVLISNPNSPQVQLIKAKYCSSFLCQLRGLTFRKQLPVDQGLLLVQKQDSRLNAAIHMMFVWIDLSVIWINSEFKVVDVILARRWRLAYVPRRPARYVLELAASRLSDFNIGDQVQIEET